MQVFFMPRDLQRFQQTGQSRFLTFSCYRRRVNFGSTDTYDLLHRNPVKRGLVKEAGDWEWSSFRHYALREIGVVEIESEWAARDRETKTSGGSERVFLHPG